ncbi:alpha/beta hydrolase family protein [Roseibium aquae]|uniref:alpha/beta hydrolase family protein n=1 Tax=Roseibium aquae TaxID=1323746 RepID=UPI0019D61956|nr:hypothetical protein [Roseibium aquae]
MKKAILAAAALATAVLPAAAAQKFAGYDRIDIRAEHRSGLIPGSVWYPAGGHIYTAPVGDSIVFKGTPALIGAAIAEGSYPLVVISHGSGGNMDGLGWLSSELALRGAMVLAVNHPGSTSGDSSPRRSARFAERVWDLTAALDHVLDDKVFGPHIDPSRIYALGFSLGGDTVLQAMGLQFRAHDLGVYCAERPAAPGCDFYGAGGVDFRAVDFALTDGNYADPRFAGVVAVDPGWPNGFTQESVAAMDKPALLINLGSQDTIWPEVNMGEKGANWGTKFRQATFVEIAPAHHFSFLGICKDGAAELLRDEGEDPICDDPEGSVRSQVHRRVIEATSAFLGLE